MPTISEKVTKIEGVLNSFVIQYNYEKEADNIKFKDFKDFLQNQVSNTLNHHKELKDTVKQHTDDIKEIRQDINAIMLSEKGCPISGIKVDVEKLKDETDFIRAKYKYPEIKKGLNLLNTITNLISLVTLLGLILTIILNWDKIQKLIAVL